MNKDDSSKIILIAAIIGFVGVTCAALIGILPELLEKIPKVSATASASVTFLPGTPELTETPQPTDYTPTEPAEPTRIIPTGLVRPGLPQGYTLYDDFNTEQAFTENWSVDDPKKICDLTVGNGNLFIDCQNKTKNLLKASIHPSKQFVSISGVASLVTVTEVGGSFQLTTDWECASETTERAYHLQLNTNQVEAVEYYPLEDWRGIVLGSYSISAGQPHLIQIEVSGGQVIFLVDGASLTLTTTPNFPTCLSMNNFGYSFLVSKDNNLISQVDLTGVKH